MLISCQNCATAYQIDPSTLGPAGRSVRCARCQKVWFASNPLALAGIAEAYRADVAALSASTDASSSMTAPLGAAPPHVESPPLADSDLIPDGGLAWEAPAFDGDNAAGSPDAKAGAENILAQLDQPLADVQAPALAPVAPVEPAAPASPPRKDIETVASRRSKKKSARWRLRWPLTAWPTAIVALIVINGALIIRRADIVAWVPQTASLYASIGLPVNLRGLDFADVTTKKEIRDGVQVLVVEGKIVSVAKHAADIPRLRFGVRNEAGREIYSWTALPDRKVLPAGETMEFHSLLAAPPREGREVVVRFFTRRDLVADIQ